MRSFDIFRLLSFYASMAGFYVTTLQSMWSVYLLTLCQLLLATMGMETYDQFEYSELGRSSSCDAASASGSSSGSSSDAASRRMLGADDASPPVGASLGEASPWRSMAVDGARRMLNGELAIAQVEQNVYFTYDDAELVDNCTAPPSPAPREDFFQVDLRWISAGSPLDLR